MQLIAAEFGKERLAKLVQEAFVPQHRQISIRFQQI
jgi:hypothetical protein